MKVLFDYQAFNMQTYGGVSKCFCELVSHFPSGIYGCIGVRKSNNVHLHASKLLSDLPYSLLNQSSFITKRPFRGKLRLYKFLNDCFPFLPSEDNLNRRFCIDLLKQGDFDIFHPTFFDDYFLPYLGNKPFVLTIHDMMPELFPQYFHQNDCQIIKKRELVRKASAIVVVSEQTKTDVMRILKVPEEKIFVIYHGGPEVKSLVHERPIVKGAYFLYVGTRNAYKNFQVMLRAFTCFATSHPDVKLVCTGSPFSKNEYKQIVKLGIQNSVIHLSVNDRELANLYTYAIAFVYPSLYEGFGMPILEAYAYGCPVILSHCSCFPEIAGDAALFFDTHKDYWDLAEKLDVMWNMNVVQRSKLIEAGKKRLMCFSWERAAQQLCNIYNFIVM